MWKVVKTTWFFKTIAYFFKSLNEACIGQYILLEGGERGSHDIEIIWEGD